MRVAFCCLALLLPIAALHLHKAEVDYLFAHADADTESFANADAEMEEPTPQEKPEIVKPSDPKFQPKFAQPEGVELIWQLPHESWQAEPKGILLYLHGCHGRATNMWSTEGRDGFKLQVCTHTKNKECNGYTEEVMMRQKARKEGYLVAAVSGGIGNARGCMNTNDVPRIQLAMQHLIEKEPDFAEKPVIMTGFSSGGRILPELVATGAGVANAKCIVPIADEIRTKGDSEAPLGPTIMYPEDVSAFFLHFKRDVKREGLVQRNIQQMKEKGVRTGDFTIPEFVPVTPELFYSEGYGSDMQTSKRMFKILQKSQLIDGKKSLTKDPQLDDKHNWKDAFKGAKAGNTTVLAQAGGAAKLQRIFDVSVSVHYMAGGRYLNKILQFCEQPGNARKHELHLKAGDLKAKVRSLNQQHNEWVAVVNAGGPSTQMIAK